MSEQDNKSHANTGFAAMDENKVKEIASKGGQARAEQLGHEGYVELGRKGGQARAEQLGHEGYVEMGSKGGKSAHHSSSSTSSNSNKGFASMDKEKVKDIARKGGKNSHKNG